MTELIERFYSPDDLPSLRRLWSKVYEPESVARREEAFRWIVQRNPACQGEAPRHLIFHGDELVGSLGCMPVAYQQGDRPFLMHYSHDLLVDPGARGLGLGKKLVHRVGEHAPGPAGGLWMTEACYALHQRAGWAAVQPFHGQAVVTDAGGLIRRRTGSRLLGSLLGPAAGVWLGRRGRIRQPPAGLVREVERFDAGIDDLFRRAAPVLGIIAVRSPAYLNWKYADAPRLRYRRFVAGPADAPGAYVVTRLQQREDGHASGLVVDLLADPADPTALEAAMAAAVAALAGEGAEIVYALTTHPPFRGRLEAIGFRHAPKEHTFVIHGHESLRATSDPILSSSWYLTYGDSDGDMWAGSQSWRTGREEAAPGARSADRS